MTVLIMHTIWLGLFFLFLYAIGRICYDYGYALGYRLTLDETDDFVNDTTDSDAYLRELEEDLRARKKGKGDKKVP